MSEVNITLPDGSARTYPAGVTGMAIAQSISEGLARNALHAGDGNLHENIIKDNLSDEEWNKKLPLGIREIFELCVSLRGTISGEHGIGYVQKSYMDSAFNKIEIELQKNIKTVFDPHHILNPGKMFL